MDRGRWDLFSRPTYTSVEHKVIPTRWLTNLAEGQWTHQDSGASMGIPVVLYNNPGGAGEFENHLDLIDRINSGGILQRLVIVALQAFRQRALTGGMLPEKDENGKTIDWAKVFAPAPGALWNLPEGLDIWESQQVDTGPILAASKDDVRQLSAVTRTPLPMLMPDTANSSAEGARSTENGYIFRCRDRATEARLGSIAIMVIAMAMSGQPLDDDENLDVTFEAGQADHAGREVSGGAGGEERGESIKSIQRNVLGYSPDQIAQDAIDRAQDALVAASMAPPPPQTSVQELNGSRPQRIPRPAGRPAWLRVRRIPLSRRSSTSSVSLSHRNRRNLLRRNVRTDVSGASAQDRTPLLARTSSCRPTCSTDTGSMTERRA